MNTTGCPFGYFTDQVMIFPGTSPPCESPVLGYVIFAGVIATSRLFLAIPWYIVTKRRMELTAKRTGKPLHKHPHRLYKIIASHATVGILQIFFVVMTSLNIANTNNGLSPFLAAVFFMPTAVEHSLEARYVVRLGRRLVPLSLKAFQLKQDLDRADLLLKVMGLCCILSVIMLFVSFLSGAIVEDKKWAFSAGFAFTGIYQFFVTLIVVWQFHRCIRAVKSLQSGLQRAKEREEMGIVVAGGNEDIERREKLMIHAMKSMYYQQILVFIVGLVGLVLSVLFAAFIIPLYWYIFTVAYLFFDVSFQASLVAIIHCRSRKGTSSADKSSTLTPKSSADQDNPAAMDLLPAAQNNWDNFNNNVQVVDAKSMGAADSGQPTHEPESTVHVSGRVDDDSETPKVTSYGTNKSLS